MIVLAIDPGNTQSAWLLYVMNDDGTNGYIHAFGLEPNESVKSLFIAYEVHHLAIEMVACYGMPVGAEVFETCVWIGRFIEKYNGPHTRIYRKDVKMHLCNSMKAKDSNIRQALLDKVGPQGTKKQPGPTYGISKDVWSALAIAVTFAETKLERVKA